MTTEGFIAGRLEFKGKMAVIAIAVSFLVIIIAVAVSAGFRHEIRDGLSGATGDVILSQAVRSEEGSPFVADLSYLEKLRDCPGVLDIRPVVYSSGIVKNGDDIHGVLFKGVPDSSSLSASIPRRLAELLQLSEGDAMTSYFIDEKVKARKFTVRSVYDNITDSGSELIVHVPAGDLQRLNGWNSGEVTALEVSLEERFRSRAAMQRKAAELGEICILYASEDEPVLKAVSAADRYPGIFDWLDLIDFNVVAILILMVIVAGFNMISGLLIMLFRNIPTIGTLKALGMSDRSVAGVFVRVAARIAAQGMALGNAAALLFCLVQGTTHLIRLNPENYFVPYVPIQVDIPLILAADAIAFVLIVLMELVPTVFISKVDPATTVKSD